MSGLNEARRPNPVAAAMPTVIAGTRPTRSATADHGMTLAARPSVVTDTASAAVAGPTSKWAAMSGSTAWGE